MLISCGTLPITQLVCMLICASVKRAGIAEAQSLGGKMFPEAAVTNGHKSGGLKQQKFTLTVEVSKGSPGGAVIKNLPANAGDAKDAGWIPGWGRSPGGGNGNPLLPGDGQRSPEGYSPRGCEESDTAGHTWHTRGGSQVGSVQSPCRRSPCSVGSLRGLPSLPGVSRLLLWGFSASQRLQSPSFLRHLSLCLGLT